MSSMSHFVSSSARMSYQIRNGGGGGSPDGESDVEEENERHDSLAPLPGDLLLHPHEIGEVGVQDGTGIPLHLRPAPPSNFPGTSAHESDIANAPPSALRRRSVEATSGRYIFPARNPTKRDLEHAEEILKMLQEKHGFKTPDRGNLDDPTIMWKEGKPDYTITDLHYFLGKTKNHSSGSLEEFVENFIKTWEMEATHKEFYQWTTVDQTAYEVQANGGKVFNSVEAPWVGNYNWLLSTCNQRLYDSSKETFESSHGKFRYAFPEGFPFEVLQVFSGPPKITFTWRHWAVFSGKFEGHQGNGETINMTGFGVVTVNGDTKAKRIEIYFDPDRFIEVLRGERECRDGIDCGIAIGESIAGGLECLNEMMAGIELNGKAEGASDDSDCNSAKGGQSIAGSGDESSRGLCPFSGAR